LAGGVVEHIEFEQLKSGLYLPKRAPSAPKPRMKWFAEAVNALLVLIQLVTVWVLWLTYANTVIPSRQKELLAEQLAQLEIEKKGILQEISRSKERLAMLARQGRIHAREIADLSSDKSRLLAEIKGLRANASSANDLAKASRARLAEANKSLSLAQLNIFSEQATYAIAYPGMADRVDEINSAAKGDRLNYVQTIDKAEKQWPEFGPIIHSVEAGLRQLHSSLYPSSWGPEFAGYFDERMRGFSCARPDFVELRKRYGDLLMYSKAEARESAIRAEQKVIEDGRKQGIRYVFGAKQKSKDVEISEMSSRMDVELKLTMEIYQKGKRCQGQFLKKEKRCQGQFLTGEGVLG
jgi:hypothetical protein